MGFLDDFFDMLDGASSFLSNASISYTINSMKFIREKFKSLLVEINSCPDDLDNITNKHVEKISNKIKLIQSSICDLNMDSIKMYTRMLKVVNNYVEEDTFDMVELDISSELTTYKELLDNYYDDIENDDTITIYTLNDILESATYSVKVELSQYINNLNTLSNDLDYYNSIYQEHQYD